MEIMNPKDVYLPCNIIWTTIYDENQVIDNRVIPAYVTAALKYLMHMTYGIQNIQTELHLQQWQILLFTLYIYIYGDLNFST